MKANVQIGQIKNIKNFKYFITITHIDIYFKLQVNCRKYSFYKIVLSKIEFMMEKFSSAQMNFDT